MVSIISIKSKKLSGEIFVPGDKSISHRALILGACAIGKTTIENLLESKDVLATLKALKESDIKIIIDGYGLFPFYKNDLLFIPQLFYREIFLPFGIQSTQLHINYWSNKDFEKFENFIKKHHKKIINLNYILRITSPNSIQTITNYIVEKTLKTARMFK